MACCAYYDDKVGSDQDQSDEFQSLFRQCWDSYRELHAHKETGDELFERFKDEFRNYATRCGRTWNKAKDATSHKVFKEKPGSSNLAYYAKDARGFINFFDAWGKKQTIDFGKPQVLEIREKKAEKQGLKKEPRSKDGDYYAKFKTHHALPIAAKIVEDSIKENFSGHDDPELVGNVCERRKKELDSYEEHCYPDLYAYTGCEINPDKQKSLGQSIESMNQVLAKTEKHKDELHLQHERCKRKLKSLLATVSKFSDNAINTEQIEHALDRFEKIEVPSSLPIEEQKQYSKLITEYMLTGHEHKLVSELYTKKKSLRTKMMALESERSKETLSSEEFKERAQQLNLEQAKCAEREISIDKSIAYYAKEKVSPKVIARLVFESSRQTTLRDWQQDELEKTFTDILPKIEKNEPYSVFTYQPPGAGKSTGLEMLTYISCEKCKEIAAKGGKKKMVVVLAPPANLPDLKKGLSDFYGARGMSFKHIDLSDRSSFDIEKPEKIYQSMIDNDGPIGLSSVDFAALLLKRKELVLKQGKSPKEQKQLDALDKIINGIERDAVNYVDEADSIIQPMTDDTNESNKKAVNKVLGGRYNVEDIQKALCEGKASMRQCHSMSATMGSSYGELELSGATSPENLDQFVRSAKVSSYGIHLDQILSMKPLFFECDGDDGEEAAAAIKKWAECAKARGEQDHDLNIVDAQKDGHDAKYLFAVSEALTRETGTQKELVYYSDADKKEMKYDPSDKAGDRGKYDEKKHTIGSEMTKDEVAYWTESKGKQSHTVFNKTDLIGRDGKQHLKKDGLILRDLDLSTNLSTQAYGRVKRASDAYNSQPLYNGVNIKKIAKRIDDSSLKKPMEKGIADFRKSKQALEQFLRSESDLGETKKDEVNKLIANIESKSLSLDLDKNSSRPLDDLHEESLQKELDELRQGLESKLSGLGIEDRSELINLLVKHAEASYKRDFAYKKIKIAMMVKKEFNQRTHHQEVGIATASVTGALSSAYAIENLEFQEKARKTIDEKCSSIDKSRKNKMGGDEIIENVKMAMTDRVAKVELRRPPEEVSLASVSEFVKPASLEKNIDTAFALDPEIFFNEKNPEAKARAKAADNDAKLAGLSAKNEMVNNLDELIEIIRRYSDDSVSKNKDLGQTVSSPTDRSKPLHTLSKLIQTRNKLSNTKPDRVAGYDLAMINAINETYKVLQGGSLARNDVPGNYRTNQLAKGIQQFFEKYCSEVGIPNFSQVTGLTGPLVWKLHLDMPTDPTKGNHTPKLLGVDTKGALARNQFLTAKKRAAVCAGAKRTADKDNQERISEISSYIAELRNQLKEDAREINRTTIVPQIESSKEEIRQRVEYAQEPANVKQTLFTESHGFFPESTRPSTSTGRRPKSSD